MNLNSQEQIYNTLYNNTNYMHSHGNIEQYKIKDILQKLPIRPTKILDYGCGQGGWIKLLKNLFPEAEIIGIDISTIAIKKAKERFPNILFYNLSELKNLKNFSFDFIFSHHVLEHIEDPDEYLNNVSNFLNHNGLFFLILPSANKNSFEEKIVSIIQNGKILTKDKQIKFFFEDPTHIRRFYSNDILSLAVKHNLNIINQFYNNQFWGSIERYTNSDINIIKFLFNYKKGITKKSQILLFSLRILFLILFKLMRLYHTNLTTLYINSKSIRKKIKTLSLMPIKPFILPLGFFITIMSILEWKYKKLNKNGSEMLFLFCNKKTVK